MERLAATLDAVAGGSGRLVLIEGPAGVGKTALLNEARRLAGERGMATLVAHAGEFEREFGFALVRQLLEPPVVAASPDVRALLLAGPAAGAQALLGATDADDVLGESHPAEVLHSLYWLTANLALRRPLLLGVDDVHWADAASLRWLAYLRPRLAELPLTVVATMRPLTPDSDPRLLDLSPDELIRVGALGEASVAAVLEERLGRPAHARFARACLDATGGNAFLLGELAAALADDGVGPTAANAGRVHEFGPRSVARAVRLRLLGLPPSAAALVAAAAVLGPGASWRHASALAGLRDEDVADAADALVAAHVLDAGTTIEFVHPIVRAAVHDELPASERGRLHARAARLIASDHGSIEHVAGHLLHAPPQGSAEVAETLLRAARLAAARGSVDDALRCLRRALTEPPPPGRRAALLRELGAAEVRAGSADGLVHLKEAQAASLDPRADAHCALELGNALVARGRVVEGADVFARAIDRVEPVDRELALRLEAELLAAARLDPSALAGIQDQLARHHRESLAGETPSERLLLAVLALDAVLAGRPVATVVDLAERALHAVPESTSPLVHSPPLNHAAYALIVAGRFDLAAAFYDAGVRAARARGSVVGYAIACCWRSHLEYRRGAITRAEAEARSALDAAESAEWRLGQPAALAFLIDALVERGALDEAEDALARNPVPEDESSVLAQGLVYSRGVLRLAQHRPEEALEEFLRAGSYQRRWAAENPAVMAWRSGAALAHAAIGDDVAARRLAEDELERAGSFGEPRAVGIALRVAGLLRGGGEQLELLVQAVSVLASSPAPLEHARALVDLGAAMRRGGQRAAARTPLNEGLDLAQRCGALALAERARTELKATGARTRSTTRSGVDSLTAIELRLAEMAADGMSNRAISNAVFVSMKTVETHLRSIYRKLDVASRSELPDALGRVRV